MEEDIMQQRKELSPAYIEELHKQREVFLYTIQRGDLQQIAELERETSLKFRDKQLNILKRVPNNELRSYKNILFSHNTLYSYAAEKGGLSAWQCHFISEKYAIMIEHAQTTVELDALHGKMVKEYSDPKIRTSNQGSLTIVQKAEQFIEMYFTEDTSMEELAKKMHVHPSHMMRVFKKEKGITISQFRNLRRIKEAKELIRFSNLSMTEIAIMIGFSNPQYFSTFFKEIEGMTPLEFKKTMKQKHMM